MLTSQAYKSRNGQHYTLRLTSKSALLSSINPEHFSDKSTASQFVHNLQVPLFFWENLARSNTFFSYSNWKNANPWAGIEDYIAQTLVQGSVVAYETASISNLTESRQLRSFKDTAGKSFELQPATTLLIDSTAEIQPVHDKLSAIRILQDLDITAHSAEKLNKSLNLPAGNKNSIEVLTKALIKGDVVLTQQAEALKPESTGDFVDAVFEAASVASSHNSPPAAEAPLEEEEKVCGLTQMMVSCSHKDSGARKYQLDVINSHPNHNSSERAIQVITTKGIPDYIGIRYAGNCVNDDDLCGAMKITGPNQTLSKGLSKSPYAFKVLPKKQSNDSGENSFIHFIKNHFIPDVDGIPYETYNIESEGCSGTTKHKALVQAFSTFKWEGEVSIAYAQKKSGKEYTRLADLSDEREWILNSKLAGNMGVKNWNYETTNKSDISKYFPSIQDSVIDTISSLENYAHQVQKLSPVKDLMQFDITWPKVKLGGNIELKESVKCHNVGVGGEIYLGFDPLFKMAVKMDLFDALITYYGMSILLKFKKMAAEGENHNIVLKAELYLQGEIKADLKWSKGADDKWLSKAGDKSAEASVGITMGLNTEISGKTKVFYCLTIKAGIKVDVQGARNDKEGVGLIFSLVATTQAAQPALAGKITFTGLAIYYSYYGEAGLEDADSEKTPPAPANPPRRRTGDEAGSTQSKSLVDNKSGKKKTLLNAKEWLPFNTVNNTPPPSTVKLDDVTF
jgi:hypothetical protein